MEKRTRRSFTPEFKIQALELAEQIGSTAKAAEQLGINVERIRVWKRHLGRNALTENKSVSQAIAMNESEEIKRLRKQISELEKTNYILKKAAAFFSQDHLK